MTIIRDASGNGVGAEIDNPRFNTDEQQVLGQSSGPVSVTGTLAETVLATIPLPAGSLGKNGQVIVQALWSYTNSANNKVLRTTLGGTVFSQQTATTTVTLQQQVRIANVGAANSQVGANLTNPGLSSSSSAKVSGSVNTNADQNITLTGQLALDTETITLESYIVFLYPER